MTRDARSTGRSGSRVLPYCASELLALETLPPEQIGLPLDGVLPLRYGVKRHRVERDGRSWLHTDYRFEALGCLLSWVSDAHPSLDPAHPVTLSEMPDHQLRYIDGERWIPEGQYGSGPMVVWDFGWYRPLACGEQPPGQAVVDALRRGRLNFWMQGVRLNGGFSIELFQGDWRLRKLPDSHATEASISGDDRSSLTHRTLDQVVADYNLRKKKVISSQISLFDL